MTTEDTQFTVGKTTFYQGENSTHPLFRIEPGIPCRDAREQSSELMGYVRELTITGLMEEKPMMIWAAHYLSAMAKALMAFLLSRDDIGAVLGLGPVPVGLRWWRR